MDIFINVLVLNLLIFNHSFYRKLFVALSALEAQEIASNLTSILVNGYPICRDSVLRILTEVTETNTEQVLLFAPHLMVSFDPLNINWFLVGFQI